MQGRLIFCKPLLFEQFLFCNENKSSFTSILQFCSCGELNKLHLLDIENEICVTALNKFLTFDDSKNTFFRDCFI